MLHFKVENLKAKGAATFFRMTLSTAEKSVFKVGKVSLVKVSCHSKFPAFTRRGEAYKAVTKKF